MLGEQSKWVPVSAARFSELSYGSDGASVVATGMAGEQVGVSWLPPQHAEVAAAGAGSTVPMVVKCVILAGSKVLIKVTTVGLKAECLPV